MCPVAKYRYCRLAQPEVGAFTGKIQKRLAGPFESCGQCVVKAWSRRGQSVVRASCTTQRSQTVGQLGKLKALDSEGQALIAVNRGPCNPLSPSDPGLVMSGGRILMMRQSGYHTSGLPFDLTDSRLSQEGGEASPIVSSCMHTATHDEYP